MAEINDYRVANQGHIEEGISLLELAQRASTLFEKQPAAEKRRLLDFVVSNSTWKDGELAAEYRQPFDLLADAVRLERAVQVTGTRERPRMRIGPPAWIRTTIIPTHAESVNCRAFNGLKCPIGLERPPLVHNSYTEFAPDQA